MRTFEEMDKDARPGSPFSNSTEGECWTANWCDMFADVVDEIRKVEVDA